jgi:thioredoxin 1
MESKGGYKINVDEQARTGSGFQNNGIPTLMVFKGGKMVEVFMGAEPKEALADMLNKHL